MAAGLRLQEGRRHFRALGRLLIGHWNITSLSMPEVTITEGSQERHTKAVSIIAAEFRDDPVIRWTLHDLTPERRAIYHIGWFDSVLKAGALNGATFYEANDWQSCLVLMHPGEKVDNPRTWFAAGLPNVLWNMGLSGCKRMLIDYPRDIERIKHAALGSRPFYYVFFIATQSNARNQGLCSALLQQVQRKAAAESLPVWLEATTAHSRDIYLKAGFKVLEEVRLGAGNVGEDGNRKPQGEGVRVWAMIWESDSNQMLPS